MSTLLRPPATVETTAQDSGLPPEDSWRRRIAPEGLLALAGFAAAAEGMAGSVAAGHWQPGLSQLPLLLGLAVGLAFLFTRGRGLHWALHVLALVIGLVVASRVAGTGFLPTGTSWQNALYKVLADLSDWVSASMSGKMTQDNLLISLGVASFLFIWTYTAFILATQLRLAWLAAGMLGAALFANVLFKPNAAGGWATLWAAGSLLLILGVHLTGRDRLPGLVAIRGWPAGSQLAMGGGLIVAAIATAIFASGPPVKMNSTLNQAFQRLNGPIGRAREAYDNIGVPQQVAGNETRYDSFQQQLRFLGPFSPGNALVLQIQSDRPRYEQGLVFDRYDHQGWTDTGFNDFQFSSSSEYTTGTAQQQTLHDRDRTQVQEQITVVSPKGALLFAPPQPVGTSIRLKGDGLGNLRATQIIQPGETYTAASLESTATADALAAASGPIPDDVRRNYLQLPSDMPSRVHQLAEQLTSNKPNNFEKASAVEAYMRTLTYDTRIPPPPAGRDAVDWFLFDEKRGYCDYDSSAMAVLLRSVGIPARVAAGYSPGAFDPMHGTVQVTEEDTHTWTQVYFPGYGWIDFEPTPNDPLVQRAHDPKASSQPSANAAGQQSPNPDASTSPAPNPSGAPTNSAGPGAGLLTMGLHSRTFPWLVLLLALALLGGGGWFLWNRLRGSPGVVLAYARVRFMGTVLGMRAQGWQTPAEYGRELQARRRFDPSATNTITGLYAAHRYAAQPLDERGHHRAWTAWLHLKGRLLRPWRR